MIIETKKFFVVHDTDRVTSRCMLIISKYHRPDVFDLTKLEWEDLEYALYRTKQYLEREYHPHGYNIGIDCDEAAGQTTLHFYANVIPRFRGDVKNPSR